MISLLHPSYKRPEKSFAAVVKWVDKSINKDFEIIISLDSSDENIGKYLSFYTDNVLKKINGRIVYLHNRNAVQAINYAAEESKGGILIVVSDDTDCPDGWDDIILTQASGKKDWIAKFYDGIQDWIITMPVMDREYYNRFGYIYFPGYVHMFCDTELTCVADMMGRKLNFNGLFPHNHYSIGKSRKDEVSVKADASWKQGENLFISRYRKKFDLVGDLKPITDQKYLNWLRNK